MKTHLASILCIVIVCLATSTCFAERTPLQLAFENHLTDTKGLELSRDALNPNWHPIKHQKNSRCGFQYKYNGEHLWVDNFGKNTVEITLAQEKDGALVTRSTTLAPHVSGVRLRPTDINLEETFELHWRWPS